MATIGQTLTAPEEGWKRIDDRNVNIQYIALNTQSTVSGSYLGTITSMNVNQSGTVFYCFNFTGTKLRILSRINSYSTDISVKIDGVLIGNYSTNGSNTYQALVFEKIGLDNKEHYVEVINNVAITTNLDAIDIDSLGQIKPFRVITYNNKILLSSLDGKMRSYIKGVEQVYTSDLVPKMTSNTAPSGIVSASSNHVNFPIYNAFSDVSTNSWLTVSGQPTGWLQYQFPTSKRISKYTLTVSVIARAPKKWTFEGSNDGDWVVLDARENEIDWELKTLREFIFDNKISYLKYRINVTENNGDAAYLGLEAMEMMGIEIEKELPKIKCINSQSEQNFINHGMTQSDLSSIDMSADFEGKHYIQDVTTVLGTGKVFEHVLDTNKVLKKIKIN